MGRRALQCSNCTKFVFPFSGTVVHFVPQFIPNCNLSVKRLVFVFLRAELGTRCCRSKCFYPFVSVMGKCGLVFSTFSRVDVSTQSNGVSVCIQFQ